jgi:hypothetical protein
VPNDVLAQMVSDVGRAGLAFPGEPDLCSGIAHLLALADTITSIAAQTFLAICFGGPMSVGAGWSRAASARLAGMGGVISMIGTIGAHRAIATH